VLARVLLDDVFIMRHDDQLPSLDDSDLSLVTGGCNKKGRGAPCSCGPESLEVQVSTGATETPQPGGVIEATTFGV
jgi:hypothetical protein